MFWLHVKWFVPFEELVVGKSVEFSLFDSAVQIGGAFVLIALLIAFFLNKKIETPGWLLRFAGQNKAKILWFFQLLIAIFLLITAYQNVLFAPIFIVDTFFEKIVGGASVLAAFLLIFNLHIWLAGLILTAIYLSGGFLYGFVEMLEHIHLLGVAIFLALFNLPAKKFNFPISWRENSYHILRILTGVALMVLAWVEKLSYPTVAEEFLKLHSWNFIHDTLGIAWFTNHFFVIFVGMTEFLFGLIFILGWVVRLNTIALAICFISTAMILGPHEILGHLPVFAIAILFLVWGNKGPKPAF